MLNGSLVGDIGFYHGMYVAKGGLPQLWEAINLSVPSAFMTSIAWSN